MKVYAEHYFISRKLTAEIVNDVWDTYSKIHPTSNVYFCNNAKFDNKPLCDFVIKRRVDKNNKPYLTCQVEINYSYGGRRLYRLK